MADLTATLDKWADGGAAALTLEQPLRPVVGTVVFPPTFAPVKKGDPSDYIIDDLPNGGAVCLDTPGSQANRYEPLFMQEPLSALVPQITITAGNQRKNLLELGHRVADALARSTDQGLRIREAFEATQLGDHVPLAHFAPTSLVFGAWDSRDTGAKLPRLLESRIDVYGVQRRRRAAQYFSAIDFVEQGLLDASKEKKELDQRSAAGFRDSPSGLAPGGVELLDGARVLRTVTVHLSALRRLGASTDKERGAELRRYVLSLALAVAISPAPVFLRQGCSLVPSKTVSWKVVGFNGSEDGVSFDQPTVIAYAVAARDRLFGAGWKAEETWTATKPLAQAEVKKRSKGEDSVVAAT